MPAVHPPGGHAGFPENPAYFEVHPAQTSAPKASYPADDGILSMVASDNP